MARQRPRRSGAALSRQFDPLAQLVSRGQPRRTLHGLGSTPAPAADREMVQDNIAVELPIAKTIGMVAVAALAARADIWPPIVIMTATCWRTRSAASPVSRSY